MSLTSKHTILIVAGGRGTRMGGPQPKQFLELAGRPVLMHTLEAFDRWDASARLIVVLPEDQIDTWKRLCEAHAFGRIHRVVAGGETRFHSVRNGLGAVASNGLIAVHDGVRPLVAPSVIDACFAAAADGGAAVPVVPVVESVREVDADGGSRPVDRTRLRVVQTPQVFRADVLRAAYCLPYDPRFTDDASVVEASGVAVRLVPGNRENIKLTTPMDLLLAEQLMRQK
jgi:2-C-methyl-D-erythritol 4-phosphate cytidylyltransferase